MRAHTLVQPKNAARRGGGAVSGAVSYIKNRSQLPSTLCESFSTLHGWEVMLQLRSRLSARRRAVLGRNASPDRAVSGSRSLLRTKTTAPTHKNRRGDLLGCVCRERSGRACAHRLSCGRKAQGRRCGSPIVELWVDPSGVLDSCELGAALGEAAQGQPCTRRQATAGVAETTRNYADGLLDPNRQKSGRKMRIEVKTKREYTSTSIASAPGAARG